MPVHGTKIGGVDLYSLRNQNLVEIPEGVTTIEKEWFVGSNIVVLVLPNSV